MLQSQKYPNNSRTISGAINIVRTDDVTLLCNTSSGIVGMTLQEIPDDYWSSQYKLYVVDLSANANTNNITIDAPSGHTINGASSFVISANSASVIIRIVANKTYICQYSVIGGGGISQAYQTVQNEGTPLTQRSNINFIGTSVDATDDSANGRSNVTIQAYNTIQNEGTPLTQRDKIDFVGAGVNATDDSVNGKTIVTITDGSGTWQNIPYDDGDTTNAPGCNGRYQSSGGGGTGAGLSFADWYSYKGTAANWSTSTPSARRLKYRININGSCDIMGQIVREIVPITVSGPPSLTDAIDLNLPTFLYNVATSFATFDQSVLLHYPITIPALATGVDLVKFIPCILYINTQSSVNSTNFANATKVASFPCQCILYQPVSGSAGFIQFYVTGGTLATLQNLTNPGNYQLSIVINTTFSIAYNN